MDIDESVLRSLRKITRAIDQYSRKLAVDYKLTGPQLICMRALRQKADITATELVDEASLSKPTVTGILDRLESRGFISRERDERDRRRVKINLTESGLAVLSNAPMPLQESFRSSLLTLPLSEQKHIDAVLQRIVEMMRAETIDAVPMLASGPVTATPGETVEFLTVEQLSPSEPKTNTSNKENKED